MGWKLKPREPRGNENCPLPHKAKRDQKTQGSNFDSRAIDQHDRKATEKEKK